MRQRLDNDRGSIRGRQSMRLLRETNGAVADLGVLLPYALGVILKGLLAPAAVFAGFGVAYLAAALLFRLPIAVQPMKAVGALALAGELGTIEIMLSGVVIGLSMLALAASGALRLLAQALPQSVTSGLQLGLGMMLGLFALSLMQEDAWTGAAATVALVWLMRWTTVPAALLLVLGSAIVVALVSASAGNPPPALAPAGLGVPSLQEITGALVNGVLPQLPLTVTNAVVVTAALARELFPAGASRVTETRLAVSTGGLNLLLCPFGAMPMCHGAGGLAAHHRFGARTGLSIAFLGLGLLILAALPGAWSVAALSLVPLPVLGALLLVSAWDLAASPRLLDATPSCKLVIGLTAVVTVAANPAIGLLAGLVAEPLRRRVVRSLPRQRAGGESD